MLELKVDAISATAILRPKFARRSFINELHKIQGDIEGDSIEIMYETQSERIREFSNLIGKEFPREHDWLVRKAVEDIIYLQLALIFQKQKLDWIEEIDKYEIASSYPEFANENRIPYLSNDRISSKSADISTVINRGTEILSWIHETQDRIEKIIGENSTPNPE